MLAVLRYHSSMRLFGILSIALVLAGCGAQMRNTRQGKSRPSVARSFDPSCTPLSGGDRDVLLEVAEPANFPSTRYRKGPNPRLGIEIETDCSHFVHAVYSRAGLPYRFRSSAEMLDAPEFETIDWDDAQPGDVVVMRGHMGMLDETGKLISATRTHRRRVPSSITRYDLSSFKRVRGKRHVLRYRCRPAGLEEN